MTNKLISKVSYYDNGKIYTAYTVDEAGKKQGEYESYYENGQLKEKGTYKDDRLEGPYESYYENGQLKAKCTVKDGWKEGPYESYYENGQLWKKYTVKDKWEEGPYETYHDNGQLQEKGTRKPYRRLEGPYESYFENGQLKEKNIYKDGHPVSNPVLLFKMALTQRLQRFSQWNTARAENKERTGLNKRLEQMTKQMPPTQLRQAIKRNEVAKFRRKYPKSSGGR